jgi:hypothetical protein
LIFAQHKVIDFLQLNLLLYNVHLAFSSTILLCLIIKFHVGPS